MYGLCIDPKVKTLMNSTHCQNLWGMRPQKDLTLERFEKDSRDVISFALGRLILGFEHD